MVSLGREARADAQFISRLYSVKEIAEGKSSFAVALELALFVLLNFLSFFLRQTAATLSFAVAITAKLVRKGFLERIELFGG